MSRGSLYLRGTGATGVRSCSNAFCSATANAWRIAGLQDLTPGLTKHSS